MEKIDILLWVMGGGFALMLVMWNNIHNSINGSESRLNNKIDDIKTDLGKRVDHQGKKIDEINVKLAEVDKRLYGIETVLHMKDCCVLKQDQNLRKAE